jgi:hypothetical protein
MNQAKKNPIIDWRPIILKDLLNSVENNLIKCLLF